MFRVLSWLSNLAVCPHFGSVEVAQRGLGRVPPTVTVRTSPDPVPWSRWTSAVVLAWSPTAPESHGVSGSQTVTEPATFTVGSDPVLVKSAGVPVAPPTRPVALVVHV